MPNTGEEILSLLRELYRQMAAERNWTTEEMLLQGRIRDFVEWCRKKGLPASQRSQLLEAGFSSEVIGHIAHLLAQDDFTVAGFLLPLWDGVSLVGRGAISPKPIATVMEVVIFFEDGQKLSIANPAAMHEDMPYTDDRILVVLATQFASIKEKLRQMGCTAAVKQYGQPMGESQRASVQRLIQKAGGGV